MAVDLFQPHQDAEYGIGDFNSENDRGKTEPASKIEPLASVDTDSKDEHDGLQPVPLSWKLMSIFMVILIGFGSQWSSGITGAMKTTIKKELHITNTQFSLLEASEDFMVTALMLLSGVVTDRIGGAGALRIGCCCSHGFDGKLIR